MIDRYNVRSIINPRLDRQCIALVSQSIHRIIMNKKQSSMLRGEKNLQRDEMSSHCQFKVIVGWHIQQYFVFNLPEIDS